MVDTVRTIYGTFDEKQLKSLKGFIDEVVVTMIKVKDLNESANDILKLANEELKIPKKILKRLATVSFKQSLEEEVAEFKEFESLFEAIADVE